MTISEIQHIAPGYLASLSDEELKERYNWDLRDCGEHDVGVQRLAAECERRGLIEPIQVTPPADGKHYATSLDDYALMLDAMEGQSGGWKEAIFADAEAQGFARADVAKAFKERIGN